MEDTAELESQLVESVSAVRTIREFGLENFTFDKTHKRFGAMLQSVFFSSFNALTTAAGTEVVSRTLTILLIWTGAYFVLDHTITTGELLSFYTLAGFFTTPVSTLVSMNKSIQSALIAADRLYEIMDLDQETTAGRPDFETGKESSIEFREVSFSYGTRKDVFERFSFSIFARTPSTIINSTVR